MVIVLFSKSTFSHFNPKASPLTVVLAIGKKVKAYLEKHFEGVEVKLSRTGDKELSLKQRTDAVNAWGADLLVSIHINAGGGFGFESYVYNADWNGKAETVAMQSVIHAAIMKEVKDLFHDRGKKQKNLHMVRESKNERHSDRMRFH
jgi:N-acetylmuramoyl-L-alanine amidase